MNGVVCEFYLNKPVNVGAKFRGRQEDDHHRRDDAQGLKFGEQQVVAFQACLGELGPIIDLFLNLSFLVDVTGIEVPSPSGYGVE